jgi:glycosyltransferase involved in cell wall biosynthesis
MNILMVVGKFPDLTFIFRTIIALTERGHQVTVAARQSGDWQAFQGQLPLPPGLHVLYLLPDTGLSNPILALRTVLRLLRITVRSPRAMWHLSQLSRQNPDTRRDVWRTIIRHAPLLGMRPDVIQFDFPMTANTYSLLSALCRVPTVVSCRGSDIHMIKERDDGERNRRINALQRASALHCVSAEMANTVRRVSGRTTGIWINHPAVPVAEINAKTNWASHTPLIITVGRLTWIKGLDYLLAALARLKQAGVPFRAQIIGDGELRAVMRFSIEDMGLRSEVELVGKLPATQVLERLREADIFVLSSHDEGISNAVLEAMAVGLPIVTTAAGGMAEAVRDGIDGFVVPIRDIQALADGINRLLVDPKLRQQMGHAARTHVEAEFSLERQARVFEEIYVSAIKDAESSV